MLRKKDMRSLLLVTQGDQRVDTHRTARGKDYSRERNKNYAEQSEQKRDHIAGLDAKKHGTHEACASNGNRNASENGGRADQQTFTQNQPQIGRASCRERV